MVGAAIVRRLKADGRADIITRTHAALDLCDQAAVRRFFARERIDQVMLAAARVGGIRANDAEPGEFIRDNLMIQTNVIHEAWRAGVRRLLFLGSVCIYPRICPQPIREEALMSGPLEPTNEAYAAAKIAGIKMCEAYNRQYGVQYRSLMPANLYGPGDNFDSQNSHVIPALIGKFHAAAARGEPRVTIWGGGGAKRDFLHVDDLARACQLVMELDDEEYAARVPPRCSHINVGSGEALSIAEVARRVMRASHYDGELAFDRSKPDGAPERSLDISRITALGWRPQIDFDAGLADACRWFRRNLGRLRPGRRPHDAALARA